ncbi:MAG: hypothetical protein KGL13_06505 [Gammaproteobacteria bacterium]|nr:hypothetical protein [Gammaproteobacteria bacterium]MDE2346100.1 hypothetical protein [Gammaproteobacteria bacterium]
MRTKYILFCLAALSTALTMYMLPALAGNVAASSTSQKIFQNIKFRNLGPAIAGGRVTSVVGIPGNPKIYYAGAAGGGVWKSTDGGHHWKAIFSRQPTASIGTIDLAPSNPNLVWVGTGEVNIRNDVVNGAGLYLSTDAGKTWKLMGFKDAGQIAKVVVDPHNSNIVWVAVFGHVWGPNPERGVFKTTDGGKTWKRVLFINDHTGAIDLTMDGSNPQVLFAAMWQAQRYPWKLVDGGPDSSIWRSTDGGDTWTKLTGGIPKPPIGRISIAAAPSDPEHLYALIETRRGHGLLFTSTDLGDHWQQVSDNYEVDVRPFYFSHVYVSPQDQNRLYFTAFHLMESDDGGHTAHAIDSDVHVDHHAFWQDPSNPDRMIQGNDGGVYLSLDGGKNWRFADSLPIEQFYQVAADSKQPFDVCGGLQDNNAWCGPSQSNPFEDNRNAWFTVVGGDGQYVVPAPSNPDILYADSQDGYIVRDNLSRHIRINIKPYSALDKLAPKDQKFRFNWTAPIAVSPTDANTVYLGGDVVFKSTDGGMHWSVISPDLTRNDKSKQQDSGGPVNLDISGAETYDTILSLTLAPTDPKVIWTGTDDGQVQVTRDGGQHWSNVTPPGAPKWERVSQLGVSPFNAGTAYIAFDGHEMGDNSPHVYRTDNYGRSWHSISAGLPNEPVIVVREDPNQNGFLVLGNMTGLWYSRDDGNRWQPLQSGFPTAPVFDLKFVHHTLLVATHGRGLFVLDNLIPFEEMNARVAQKNFHLFTPSPGIEYSFAAGHLPQGAMIDYYLKQALPATPADHKRHRSPVKIVVTDADGHTISTDYGPAKAGVNQFVWDMSFTGPTPLDFTKPSGFEARFGNRGPEVLPGTYMITVSADGQTQKATVTVHADPNLSIPKEVLQANLQYGLQARNQISAFNEMLNRITVMQKALALFEQNADTITASQAQYANLLEQAQALDKKLTALKDGVYNPLIQRSVPEDSLHWPGRLNRELHSLNGFGRNILQPPTPQELANAASIRAELNSKLDQFNTLLTTDVANYNKRAFAAGAPTLMTGAPISVHKTSM